MSLQQKEHVWPTVVEAVSLTNWLHFYNQCDIYVNVFTFLWNPLRVRISGIRLRSLDYLTKHLSTTSLVHTIQCDSDGVQYVVNYDESSYLPPPYESQTHTDIIMLVEKTQIYSNLSSHNNILPIQYDTRHNMSVNVQCSHVTDSVTHKKRVQYIPAEALKQVTYSSYSSTTSSLSDMARSVQASSGESERQTQVQTFTSESCSPSYSLQLISTFYSTTSSIVVVHTGNII